MGNEGGKTDIEKQNHQQEPQRQQEPQQQQEQQQQQLQEQQEQQEQQQQQQKQEQEQQMEQQQKQEQQQQPQQPHFRQQRQRQSLNLQQGLRKKLSPPPSPEDTPAKPQTPPRITGPRIEKRTNPTPPRLKILVVGLDNAGKSSILSRMKVNKVPQGITPTVGLNIDKFALGKTDFTVFDMAGATTYRSSWTENLEGFQVIVYVVDSSDKFRMVVAREELETLLQEPKLDGVPLLVFANKNDLPSAMNYSKVSEQLGLEEIVDRSWNIISSSAVSGAGISDGVTWVLGNYKNLE